MPSKLPNEEIQRLLLEVVEHFDEEDREVRERQIRKCRRLKLYWDNIFQAWYSEVAHDWRIYDAAQSEDSNQEYYDKPMNVFRAYIESIIAALSITTPVAKCFPDDADSSLDIITARAGDKIGQLIARHNNIQLLWLHALYIFYTEGTVYNYGYPRESDKYGTYDESRTEEEAELKDVVICPICGQSSEPENVLPADAMSEVPMEGMEEMIPGEMGIDSGIPPEQMGMQPQMGMEQMGMEQMPPAPIPDPSNPEAFMPEMQPQDLCPNCGNLVSMEPGAPEPVVTTKIVGVDKKPKSRVCLEAYGGLYVKIANYAKTQEQTPYLIYSYETHYANAVEEYEHLHDKKSDFLEKIKGNQGPSNPYVQWARLNTLYQGEYPQFVVTMRKAWLRPSAFNILNDKDNVDKLKKLYPRGVKVCLVNDEFGDAKPEELDDYWTISVNPMEDYLAHDPQGINLVPGQEITNDVISLVLQTMEHGIGQTFADPGVLNFEAYRNSETIPGGVYEATPKSGKSLSEGFFEMKTANLSAEIMPFFDMIQSINQLISGALPSLFGGELSGGSNTASEYSMSRAQALQRVQNTWKLFTSWWKEVQGKAIPMFINNMKTDEKDVQRLPDGSFVNMMIRRSELEGKIGKIELEASENLPSTASQIKDTVMKIFESQNEFLITVLTSPVNLPLLRDAIGLVDFQIPGEDQRNEQNDEIRELLQSEPIADPMQPDNPELMQSSVPVDPIYNEHPIHFEMIKRWATSDAGRQAKIDNPGGYENTLLHGRMHFQIMNEQMMQQQQMEAEAENPEKPGDDKANQINEESDVNTA